MAAVEHEKPGDAEGLLRVGADDLARMRDQLLFDGPDAHRKLSRFWTLLVLASVIASAGIVGDSTATVIGAMIVAPLMTPILGSVLSIATGDGRNLVRSLALAVPLAATSQRIARQTIDASSIRAVAVKWAKPSGWTIGSVDPDAGGFAIHAAGPPPAPLRARCGTTSTRQDSRTCKSTL